MKKWFIVAVIAGLLFSPVAYAEWDEYHEIEENSPAYMDTGGNNCNTVGYGSIANSPYYNDPSNDVVSYIDSRGCKRYTTRAYANTYGIGRGRLRAVNPYGYGGGSWNPRASTVGKRFYPNSNYKREIKAKKQRGLLGSIMGWLI